MAGFPDDRNDVMYYDDADYRTASGKQIRFHGDVLINGEVPVNSLDVTGQINTEVPDIIAVWDEKYDVRRSGAIGDGVVDDTVALNDASTVVGAVGGKVQLLRSHLVSGEIVGGQSTIFQGYEGHGNEASVVTSDALSGPVFRLPVRASGLQHVRIDSTTARRTAVTSDGHGVFITGGDVPGANLPTRMNLLDVEVRSQPTDGFHGIGPLELSKLEHLTATECARHGFVFDGGLVAGYANLYTPAFDVTFERLRAIECGGQAFIIQSTAGLAPQKNIYKTIQALGCAWNSTKRYTSPGLVNSELYQIILGGGRGCLIEGLDVEDQQYANVLTATLGFARTSLANPARGVYNGCTGTVALNTYFSSLSESWAQAASGLLMPWPTVIAGAYSTLQNPAIDVLSSNSLDVHVYHLASMTPGATSVLRNRSANAQIVANGIPQIGDTISSLVGDWADGMVPVASTITGVPANVISNARRLKINSAGGAGVADDIESRFVYSGVIGVEGMDGWFIRGNADITLKNTGGNIRCATGADITLTATNPVVKGYCDGTNWWVGI